MRPRSIRISARIRFDAELVTQRAPAKENEEDLGNYYGAEAAITAAEERLATTKLFSTIAMPDAALKVENFDPARCRLNASQALAEVKGQLVLSTATNHERRSVPYPAFLGDEIA